MVKEYCVNYYGSHPDKNNDDCLTGLDFDTLEEAEAVFKSNNPTYSNGKAINMNYIEYIELDGPGVSKLRKNPNYKPLPDDDDWKRESAMQHGMAFGCEGYNDVMGY